MPQKHRDGAWWETHWPVESDAEKFKHRLGNLVLTSGNAVLGRKSIDTKISDPTAAYFYSHATATNTEKRIDQFTDGTEWKRENILRRESEMLEFAASRWSIPCCIDNGVFDLPEEFGDLGIGPIQIQHVECFGDEENEGDEAITEGDDDELIAQ